MKRQQTILVGLATTAALWLGLFMPDSALARPGSGPGVYSDPGHGSKPTSVYCVQGKVVVRGWQNDLVRRNPGLASFNWAPITAARPGRINFGTLKNAGPYHNIKPTLITAQETLKIARQQQFRREQSLQGADYGTNCRTTCDTGAQLISRNENYPQGEAASYQSCYSSGLKAGRVQGRLLSSK
jgi:hypothetical protein